MSQQKQKNTNNLRDQSQSKSAPHIRTNNSNQKNNGKKYNNKKYYRNNNYNSPNHEQNDYYSDSGNGNNNRSPNYWNNGNFENPLYPNQPYYTPSNQYPIEPMNYMMQNMSLYEKNNFDSNNGTYSPTYYSPMGSPYDESFKPSYQGGYTNPNNYYNYENGYDSNYNYNYDYNNPRNNNYYNYEGYGNNNNNKIKSPKNYQLEKRIGEDNKRNKNLLKILDERMQIVGQVHHAVIKDCNHQGIILDLVVYDKSGFELIAEEKEDTVTYKDILKDDYNSDKEFHRYIIKSVVLDWKNLPPSISSLPIDFQIQSTYSYLPPLTTFKVYCISMDPVTNRLYIRMAKATTPVIKLPAQINTKLSFSKIQNLPSHANQGNRPRFLIIIDFEATCDFSPNPIITPDSSEIIEFPWVVLDTVTLDIVYECQLYVKPTMMEGITNYCRSLTGITEKDCENGLSLQEAINQFNNFLKTHIFPFGVDNFRIVTDSVWDLQVQLRKESIRKSIRLDWWYKDYFDLRQEFRQFYVWFPFIKRGPPLIAMLNAFGLDFVGRHHSGLDDCKSIAQIVRIMLQLHPNTFTNPKKIPENYDPEKDSSWCSFMGKCPEGAWRCSNEECLVYNKPHLTICNFCRTIRNFNIPLETSDSNPKEEFRQLPATEIKVSTIPDPPADHQPEVVTVEVNST